MPAPLIPSPPGPAGSDRDLLALGLAMEQVLERIPSPQI
jgi:hypothetical protein